MSYSDFSAHLADVLKKFELVNREENGLFEDRRPVGLSANLLEMLQDSVPLASAIGTEKARSELIIAPVLFDLVRTRRPRISLFSGVDLPVDAAAGLTGTCDFLISASPEQLFVKAPVVVVVEAKNESIRDGMGQCVAEMVASKIFNEREGNAIDTVYGAVTTGQIWKFSSLTGKTLQIDMVEYLIDQPDKILGILASMVPDARS